MNADHTGQSKNRVRTRIGSGFDPILVLIRVVCVHLWPVLLAAPASAAVFPEPLGWQKPVGDRWVFVQLGDPAAEAAVKSADARRQFEELRAKYPATGLYPRDGTTPVWTLPGYAPIDNLFASADGVHCARIEGTAWRTQSFPTMGRRLPPGQEAEQLDAPALTFFAAGKSVRTYTARDLVTNPDKLPHSPEHVLWAAGSALNDGTGRFVQFTQDGQKNVFDFRTGERLEKVAGGLSNPLAGKVLAAAGAVSLALGLGWLWWAFGRRKSPSSQPLPTSPAS